MRSFSLFFFVALPIFFLMFPFLCAQENRGKDLFEKIVQTKESDVATRVLLLEELYHELQKYPEIIHYFKRLLADQNHKEIQSTVLDFLRIRLEQDPQFLSSLLTLLPQVFFLQEQEPEGSVKVAVHAFLIPLKKLPQWLSLLFDLLKNPALVLSERCSLLYALEDEYHWSKSHLETLIQILEKSDTEPQLFRENLAKLLEHWTGQPLGIEGKRWREWFLLYEGMEDHLLKENILRFKDQRAVEVLQQYHKKLQEQDQLFEQELLTLLSKEALVEQLLKVLFSRFPKVRLFAIESLGKRKEAKAVDPLLLLLKEENPEIRGAVIRALTEIRDKRALEPLLALLSVPSITLGEQIQIIEKLGVFAETSIIPQLLEIFKTTSSSELQTACVKSLGTLKAQSALPLILEYGLLSKDNNLRWHSIDVLGKIGDRTLIAPLLRLQYSKESVTSIRQVLLSSLANFHDTESLPLFQEALKDPSDTLRAFAAQFFYNVVTGKESSQDLLPLIKSLQDHESIAKQAWSSLQTILENYPLLREPVEKQIYELALLEERPQKRQVLLVNCLKVMQLENTPDPPLSFPRLLRKARCQYLLELWSLAAVSYQKIFEREEWNDCLSKDLILFESLDIALEEKKIETVQKRLSEAPFRQVDSTSPYFWPKKYLTAKLFYLQGNFVATRQELDPQMPDFEKMEASLRKKCESLLQKIP